MVWVTVSSFGVDVVVVEIAVWVVEEVFCVVVVVVVLLVVEVVVVSAFGSFDASRIAQRRRLVTNCCPSNM